MKHGIFIIAIVSILAACNPSTPQLTATPIPSYTLSPNPTQTPTTAPIETPAPAENENDLDPNSFKMEVDQTYMGAKITGSLITDKSLYPSIKEVTVNKTVFAEFLAKTTFDVWQTKGVSNNSDKTFEEYMKLLVDVQAGKEDPMKIAFKAYANDTRDGISYQNSDSSVNPGAQLEYWMIPFYPKGIPNEYNGMAVRTLARTDIVLVRGNDSKNITVFDNNAYNQGCGTNIDQDHMLIYIALATGYYNDRSVASAIAGASIWLKTNRGGHFSGYMSENKRLKTVLLSGGFNIK